MVAGEIVLEEWIGLGGSLDMGGRICEGERVFCMRLRGLEGEIETQEEGQGDAGDVERRARIAAGRMDKIKDTEVAGKKAFVK